VKKSNAAALARYASQLTGGGREMIDVLVSIARDGTGFTTTGERIAAAREVLDRTCGKSAQVIEHDVTIVGATLDVTALPTSRLHELKGMLAELAAASGVAAPQLPAARVIDVGGPVEDVALEWEDGEQPEADE
jgi:hypothetical protein